MNEALHAYGVFKPVGHVVVTLPSGTDRRAAQTALLRAGFLDEDITTYTPEEMIEQVDADLAQASLLAGIGQELNLVRAHRDLARQGSHFLVVRARDPHEVTQVAEIARNFHASRAQRYGALMIEELIPVGASERQVAESNDRGLDAQTRSGDENARAATSLWDR